MCIIFILLNGLKNHFPITDGNARLTNLNRQSHLSKIDLNLNLELDL